MRSVRVRGLLIGIAVVSLLAVSAAGYRVIKRIPIAGDTGWDYITADTESRRLYVPHGTEVVVLDRPTADQPGDPGIRKPLEAAE